MIWLFALLLASLAEAKSYPERMNLYVPVPRSELQIEVPDRSAEEPSTFELSVSSWDPEDFRRKDYRGVNGKFERSFPMTSLNFSAPLLSFSRGAALRAEFGISYASLKREGLALGRNAEVEQTMSLYMARAGLEYNAPLIASFLQPYAGLALLPSLALSGQSELENSVSAFGLPFEASAGLMLKTGWDFLGFTQLTFGAGGQYVFGSIDNSDLKDLGVLGFVRVGL